MILKFQSLNWKEYMNEYIPGKNDCREKKDGNARKNTVVYLSEGKADVVTDASRQADWGIPG